MRIFFITASIVVILFILYAIGIIYFSIESPSFAQFGDSFGVFTSFFSGAAFFAVTYAISIQRKELKLLQEELQETKKHLAEQTFINIFHKQLDSLNKCLQSLSFTRNNKTYSGRKCFFYLFNESKGETSMTNFYDIQDELEDYYLNIKNIFLNISHCAA